MSGITEETGWNQRRYDIRTYTTQNERNRRVGTAGEIPEKYIYIGDKCFMNNGKVHGVVLPPECRVIGKQAFEGCQFQKMVVFPESLVEIKKRAFAGNRRLRKTVFPHNIEKIGAQCYRECSNVIKAGKKNGTAKITVTLASGKKATLKVKVQTARVNTTKISGLKKNVSLKKGQKLTLKPVISPLTSQEKVTYTSSNKKVATVSKKGVITAKKKGTVKITVKSGKKSYVIKVKVK